MADDLAAALAAYHAAQTAYDGTRDAAAAIVDAIAVIDDAAEAYIDAWRSCVVSDDILRRLRNPELPCICTDVVLLSCHPCNARLDAADEIERLRALIAEFAAAWIATNWL